MSQPLVSPNFAFLAVHDPLLVRLAAQAEGYVFTDSETALFKLRQWVETLAKQIARRNGTTTIADQAGMKTAAACCDLEIALALPHEKEERDHLLSPHYGVDRSTLGTHQVAHRASP